MTRLQPWQGLAVALVALLTGFGGNRTATPAAQPAGKILYRHAAQLKTAALDGRGRRLIAALRANIDAAAWSPDGTRILVHTADATLVLDDRGRELAHVEGRLFAASWSPGGRRVVTDGSSLPACNGPAPVARPVRLLLFDSGGRRVRDLTVLTAAEAAPRGTSVAQSITSVAWAPDARRIAYVLAGEDCADEQRGLGRSMLDVVDLARGTHTTLARSSGWSYIGPPAWSPDGRSLAFAEGCAGGGLAGDGCDRVVVHRAGQRDRVLLARQAPLADTVLWSRDHTLAFGTVAGYGRPGLGSVDVGTGRFHWLVKAGDESGSVIDNWFPIFKLSRNGRQIVSVVTDSGPVPQIVVASLDGSGTRTRYSLEPNAYIVDVFVP